MRMLISRTVSWRRYRSYVGSEGRVFQLRLKSLLQSIGKGLHAGKALFGILSEGCQHHFFNLRRNRCELPRLRCRWTKNEYSLTGYLGQTSMQGGEISG